MSKHRAWQGVEVAKADSCSESRAAAVKWLNKSRMSIMAWKKWIWKKDYHTNLAKEMGFIMDLVIWLMQWQEMRGVMELITVLVVPEGIYNILSGIEGDTMGTVRKQGVRNIPPPPSWCWIIFTLRQSNYDQMWLGLKTLIFMSINQTGISGIEPLPASVKGTSEVQSTGARFVVSSGAKAIHKSAVGERSLNRNRKRENPISCNSVSGTSM